MKVNRSLLTIAYIQFIILSGCAQRNKIDEQSANDTAAGDLVYNRLINAKSPYLQQHADNPVDWYEWGPEALEKAKEENKPLIISIGYAACHWCHVMEHESFNDSAVAEIMNNNFISVKIDREERPDIDQVYMNAAHLITGRGGWPLNAFALPDGRPFYAGTYFPKKQWIDLLKQVSDIYDQQYDKIVQQAEQLTSGIRSQEIITAGGDSTAVFQKDTYNGIFKEWRSLIDYSKGGYKNTPKFPVPVGWEFLLQYYYLTENDRALEAVVKTLDEMAKGGIYDQIGGGFARYSTDARWFAPHFEKMLYDNGQLVSLYANAYKVTKKPLYEQVLRETLEFIEREMASGEGGFFSSINADSEGEEGKFYVWTNDEIDRTLKPDVASLIKDYYQVKRSGNWENKQNILYRKESAGSFAQKNKLSEKEWSKILARAKNELFQARNKRERPTTDDKILTSWNALMLKGYLNAYHALGDEKYLTTALENARFLEENMVKSDHSLWRTYKDGEAGIEAFLDDYALLAEAYIELYQATFDKRWLDLAKNITDYAVKHFRDDQSGMFYYASDQAEKLIARKMEIKDNVIPSSNSTLAHVLYRLGEYYYHQEYIQMSKMMLSHIVENVPEGGPYYANWGKLLGLIAHEPYEIAVMGKNAKQLAISIQRNYLPTSLFMGGNEENLPLLEFKLPEDETLIYVCRNKTCKLPVDKPEEALIQIK